MTNVWCVKNTLANCDGNLFANFTSPKSRIALQVARKIAPCDRALVLTLINLLYFYTSVSFETSETKTFIDQVKSLKSYFQTHKQVALEITFKLCANTGLS